MTPIKPTEEIQQQKKKSLQDMLAKRVTLQPNSRTPNIRPTAPKGLPYRMPKIPKLIKPTEAPGMTHGG
jgi:hypothetical protein